MASANTWTKRWLCNESKRNKVKQKPKELNNLCFSFSICLDFWARNPSPEYIRQTTEKMLWCTTERLWITNLVFWGDNANNIWSVLFMFWDIFCFYTTNQNDSETYSQTFQKNWQKWNLNTSEKNKTCFSEITWKITLFTYLFFGRIFCENTENTESWLSDIDFGQQQKRKCFRQINKCQTKSKKTPSIFEKFVNREPDPISLKKTLLRRSFTDNKKAYNEPRKTSQEN